jgi:hypothetical protein
MNAMTNAAPSIKLSTLRQIAPYLGMRGVSPLEFFRRYGISPQVFQNPEAWIPRAACFHIANEMAAVAQDPFAGASVGHLIEVRSLGVWGEWVLGLDQSGSGVCIGGGAHGFAAPRQ